MAPNFWTQFTHRHQTRRHPSVLQMDIDANTGLRVDLPNDSLMDTNLKEIGNNILPDFGLVSKESTDVALIVPKPTNHNQIQMIDIQDPRGKRRLTPHTRRYSKICLMLTAQKTNRSEEKRNGKQQVWKKRKFEMCTMSTSQKQGEQ